MRILAAEDDPVAMRILQLTLESSGHEVTLAHDGDEAWQKLNEQSFQVVVSDWMMPKTDGLELCRRVRQLKQKNYVYFILLTARVGSQNFLEAMDAGVDDFLAKPLRREEMRVRLRVAERILQFMDQLRELKKLLPICCYCKRIRDDKDYWHQVEVYIRHHAGVDFSHGICPECYEKIVLPQIAAYPGAGPKTD